MVWRVMEMEREGDHSMESGGDREVERVGNHGMVRERPGSVL